MPSVLENYIDGKEFLLLTEKEIKEMVPPIGLTKKIIRLLPQINFEVCKLQLQHVETNVNCSNF